MPLFKVTLDSETYDPNTWPDCQVLGFGDRQFGRIWPGCADRSRSRETFSCVPEIALIFSALPGVDR